jgi:hypothetical protein
MRRSNRFLLAPFARQRAFAALVAVALAGTSLAARNARAEDADEATARPKSAFGRLVEGTKGLFRPPAKRRAPPAADRAATPDRLGTTEPAQASPPRASSRAPSASAQALIDPQVAPASYQAPVARPATARQPPARAPRKPRTLTQYMAEDRP